MRITSIIRSDSRLTGGLLILLKAAILITTSSRADVSEQQAKREADFNAADVNGDCALTQSEFQAFIDANADDNLGHGAKIRRFGTYDRAFNKLDKDRNGTVTWSEVMDGRATAN